MDQENDLSALMSVGPKVGKVFAKAAEILGRRPERIPQAQAMVERAANLYVLMTVRGDLFRESLARVGSDKAKAVRADMRRISRHADQLIGLLHETEAGARLRAQMSKSAWADVEKVISVLAAASKVAAEEFKPQDGRAQSEERRARIAMVARLIVAARHVGLFPGSGQTGPFPELISSIYGDALGIDAADISRDIRDASKIADTNQLI